MSRPNPRFEIDTNLHMLIFLISIIYHHDYRILNHIYLHNTIFPFYFCFSVSHQQDSSRMGRRDVMESITNVAFGLTTGSVIVSTPIVNYDIAFAATNENAAAQSILMDGLFESSPTSLFLAQTQTPKQKMIASRQFIQLNWIAYIDANNWTTLNSSYNTQNTILRSNANTIVNQNPSIPLLVTRRTELFNALTNAKAAFDAKNKDLSSARTLIVQDKITAFTNLAPNP